MKLVTMRRVLRCIIFIEITLILVGISNSAGDKVRLFTEVSGEQTGPKPDSARIEDAGEQTGPKPDSAKIEHAGEQTGPKPDCAKIEDSGEQTGPKPDSAKIEHAGEQTGPKPDSAKIEHAGEQTGHKADSAKIEHAGEQTGHKPDNAMFGDAIREQTGAQRYSANFEDTVHLNTHQARSRRGLFVDGNVNTRGNEEDVASFIDGQSRGDTADILYLASLLFKEIQSKEGEWMLRNEALSESDIKTVLTTEVEKCPFRQTCHLGNRNISWYGLDSKGDEDFCCMQCSCLNNCGIVNTCCPDVTESWRDVKKEVLYAPHRNYGLYNGELATNCSNYIIDTEYKMGMFVYKFTDWVSTCPERFENETSILCERDYQESDDAQFHQLVPFGSSVFNVIIYKNKYCAICNDIDLASVGPLQPVMTCLEFDPLVFIIENINIPHKYDEFLSNQDNGIGGQQQFGCSMLYFQTHAMRLGSYNADPNCVRINIDKCNVTGLWDGNQPFLSRACASYVSPVYTTAYGYYTYYANVFCKMCNPEPNFGLSIRKCRPPETQWTTPDEPWVTTSSFDFNINPVFSQSMIDELFLEDSSGSADCEIGYIFDPHENICRRIICPVTFYPGITECEPIMNSIYSIPFHVSFKVKLSDVSVSSSSESLIVITTDIMVSIFKEKLPEYQTVCGYAAWYSEQAISVNGAPFFMFDELVINIYVNGFPLGTNYKRILNTTEEFITAVNEHFSLGSKLIDKVSINDEHTIADMMKESEINKDILAVCKDGFKIWKQMFCDRILLNTHTFETRNGPLSNNLQLKNKFLKYNENKTAVCFDDYILSVRTIRTAVSSGAEMSFKDWHCWVLVLITYLIGR